jgi:hypothetical protein
VKAPEEKTSTGTCTNQTEEYVCVCEAGFTGENCTVTDAAELKADKQIKEITLQNEVSARNELTAERDTLNEEKKNAEKN